LNNRRPAVRALSSSADESVKPGYIGDLALS
jgi:hypothetical protein